MESGPLSEWLGDIGTLALFGWTLWTWRRERAEIRAESIRAQASERLRTIGTVNAWVQRPSEELKRRAASAQASGPDGWFLVLQNGTDEPVYEWQASVYADPPGKTFRFDAAKNGVLPPYGTPQVLALPIGTVSASPDFDVTFEFSSLGAKWRRDRTGLTSV